MGGCNSIFSNMTLLAGPIGAGIANLISPDAVNAINSVGFPGLPFSNKSGCSPNKDAVIQTTQEIIASAIVTSFNSCDQTAIVDQQISITCHPSFSDPNMVYEANTACGNCNSAVFKGMLQQHVLEEKLNTANPSQARVRLPINNEFVLMLSRLGICGISTCKACSLANVTQASFISASSTCYDQITDVNLFKTNLTSLISQSLLSNQDVLAGVAKAFANSNVTQVSEVLSSQIASYANYSFLQDIASRMQSSQIITINGSSVEENNITQTNAFTIALQSVITNNIVENALGTEIFNLVEQVANSQNTLDDAGNLVFQSSVDFVAAINNVVGQVLISVLVVLGVVILFIIGYSFVKGIKGAVQRGIEMQKHKEMIHTQTTNIQLPNRSPDDIHEGGVENILK